MKQITAIFLALFCIFFITLPAFASESDSINDSHIIQYSDGSSLEIVTTETATRASGSKTGNRAYIYRDNNGETKWQAVLTANFTYTGSSSTCTSASCSVTIYDTSWYQAYKSTSHSGNTATAQLTMGHKILGVTVSKPSYTITLSCDANGNLS